MPSTVETLGGRISRAKLFKDNVNMLFFAIGRTVEWANESSPPEPTGTETNIDQIIGFKKVEDMHFVVEDPIHGTLVFQDSLWRIVPEGEIVSEGCHWVYLSANIVGNELPLSSYRQIGLYSDVVPLAGYEANTELTPAQVESNGLLEVITNRTVVHRASEQTDKFFIVLEF